MYSVGVEPGSPDREPKALTTDLFRHHKQRLRAKNVGANSDRNEPKMFIFGHLSLLVYTSL